MSSIKKNFLYNAGYRILDICIPLFTTPYLSRVLGSDGLGIYSYSHSIAYFFTIFIMLGVNNYGCREVAKIRDNKEALCHKFWSIYFLQIALGVFINGLYIGYCLLIAKDKATALIMGLFTVSACFDVNWFYGGMEKFKSITIRNFVIKLVKTVAIFLLVREKSDTYIYCVIMVVGTLISQLVLWPGIIGNIKFVLPNVKEILAHLKPNLLLFMTTLAVSLFKYMDKIMLGSMSNVTQLGFYEASERIIAVPTTLIAALGTTMLPRATNLLSRKSDEGNKLLHVSIWFAMFISSSICFGIMGVSREFVPLFYGKGFEICVNLYLILLPSCMFMAFANVIRTQYLLPRQMDREYVTSAILGAVVNLIINSLLIIPLGAIGVALGTFIAEFAVCYYQSSKVAMKIPISRFLFESIPFVVSGLIMFVILYFWNLPNLSAVVALGIKVIAGIFIYFIVLALAAAIFRINYFTQIRKSFLKNKELT